MRLIVIMLLLLTQVILVMVSLALCLHGRLTIALIVASVLVSPLEPVFHVVYLCDLVILEGVLEFFSHQALETLVLLLELVFTLDAFFLDQKLLLAHFLTLHSHGGQFTFFGGELFFK